MRRIIIFILLLGMSAVIVFASCGLFLYDDSLLSSEELNFGDVSVSESEAKLEVFIFPDKTNKYYAGYKTSVDSKGIMIVEILASYVDKTHIEKGVDGNFTIIIPLEEKITEIKYATTEKTQFLWEAEN